MADNRIVSGLRETLEWAIQRGRETLPPPVFADAPSESAQAPPRAERAPMALAVATTVLSVLALLYTLYAARELVMPIVVAILLGFLLRPLVRALRGAGIKEPLGAAIVVLGAVVVLGGTGALLATPASSWAKRAPEALQSAERKLRTVSASLLRIEATAAKVEQLASGDAAGDAVPGALATAPRTPFMRRFVSGVADAIGLVVSIAFLTYFLLASGDLFVRKMMKVLPHDAEEVPKRISEEIESSIARYLRTVVMINLGLGIVTWVVLLAVGMPNAALWGAVAGLLNFIPFLGAVVTVLVLAVAAITVFDSIGRALLVPLAFLFVNLIESNVFTPALMGRQFPLNAVALFLGVMFWGYVWGAIGAILAVPMMVTLKIVCDHVPALHPVAEFLGQ